MPKTFMLGFAHGISGRGFHYNRYENACELIANLVPGVWGFVLWVEWA
jgi:hypothetical protein